MKKVALLLFPLLFVGCASLPPINSLKPMEMRELSSKTYPQKYHEVFGAAIKALENLGYKIASAYESTGTIDVERKGKNVLWLILNGRCSRAYYDVTLQKLPGNKVEVVATYYHIFEHVTGVQYDATGEMGKDQYQAKVNSFFNAVDVVLQRGGQ